MTAQVLQGEGLSPKLFTTLGKEKSSIWLFMIIPVNGSRTCEPKIKFTEDVTDTAMPSL
jgi:hypothetical protein